MIRAGEMERIYLKILCACFLTNFGGRWQILKILEADLVCPLPPKGLHLCLLEVIHQIVVFNSMSFCLFIHLFCLILLLSATPMPGLRQTRWICAAGGSEADWVDKDCPGSSTALFPSSADFLPPLYLITERSSGVICLFNPLQGGTDLHWTHPLQCSQFIVCDST